MSGQRHNPPDVWKPFGPFSMMALQGDGQIVHLKGQVSLDEAGNVEGNDDMPAQVDRCLRNIRATLESVGGRMEDVYALVHHVTDMEAFSQAGHVRSGYFSAPYPVTTTVEVRRLFHPDLLVEITASAEIPRARFREPGTAAA